MKKWPGLLLAVTLSASAQSPLQPDDVGTIYIQSHKETADGKLRACGLEFAVISRDFATKGGDTFTAVGSYYVRAGDSFVGWTLKLGIRDGVKQVQSAPAGAFLRAKDGLPPPKSVRTDSDTPGFALFVGAVEDTQVQLLEDILTKNRAVLGFSRQKGQQDVNVDIDFTVRDSKIASGRIVRDHSPEMVNSFSQCTTQLTKR